MNKLLPILNQSGRPDSMSRLVRVTVRTSLVAVYWKVCNLAVNGLTLLSEPLLRYASRSKKNQSRNDNFTFAVCKLDRIGDGIISLPLIQSLIDVSEGTPVLVFVSKKTKAVFEAYADISALHLVEIAGYEPRSGYLLSRFCRLFGSAFRFRCKANYIVKNFIATRGDVEENCFGILLGAETITDFAYPIVLRDSAVRLIEETTKKSVLSASYFLSNQVWPNLATPLFGEISRLGGIFVPTVTPYILRQKPEIEIEVQRKLRALGITGNFLLIAPHAGSTIRDLPPQLVGELISAVRLLRRDLQVVFVSERTSFAGIEEVLVEDIRDGIIVLAAGQFTLAELPAVLRRSVGLCSTDTSFVHLSRMLSIPTVAFFGPTDRLLWFAASENSRLVTLNYPCSPCGDRCVFSENFCLTRITRRDFEAQLLWLLSQKTLENNLTVL